MSVLLYAEQAAYVAKVLEVLNSEAIPNSPDFYLHIELRNEIGTKIATFSDEISNDCWSVEFED